MLLKCRFNGLQNLSFGWGRAGIIWFLDGFNDDFGYMEMLQGLVSKHSGVLLRGTSTYKDTCFEAEMGSLCCLKLGLGKCQLSKRSPIV